MRASANPQSSGVSPTSGCLLQRKCACGSSATQTEGQCEDCQRKKAMGVQARLVVGATDDPLEVEADRAAAQVLRAPDASQPWLTPARVFRLTRRSAIPSTTAEAPPSVSNVLRAPGDALPASTRAFFEPRFGHDFAKVRVHRDAHAAASARDVSAQAYTVGHDIVFGAGQYQPTSPAGRSLLAHELAHVVQQRASGPSTIRRAVLQQGRVTITIDYGGLSGIAEADRADRIVAMTTTLTGVPPSAAQESAVRALGASTQEWLLYALDLHLDNRAAASGLAWDRAVQRLIAFAPTALFAPRPDPQRDFAREALRVSGWSETAQAQRLSAPSAADRTAIRTIANPPPTSGRAGDPLNVAQLRRRLPPALTRLLTRLDPSRWTNIGTRSISTFQAIGDVAQQEARSFFAPYADAAAASLYDLRPAWHASANIFDVGTVVPDQAMRLGYLQNRAEIVGRTTTATAAITDPNIFADVHFDPTRAADRAELHAILTTLEADPAVAPVVDRLIQHTGRKTGVGSGVRIGLVTEFNADTRTACADHWQGIDTVCHEVLHALAHADFTAAAGRISFPQVVREGFTEVLGAQLFNDRIVPKANANAAFKASLEAGVTGAPCPAPAPATIDYGSAGSGAEDIRSRVRNERFRAAYFLGRPKLAGLPT